MVSKVTGLGTDKLTFVLRQQSFLGCSALQIIIIIAPQKITMSIIQLLLKLDLNMLKIVFFCNSNILPTKHLKCLAGKFMEIGKTNIFN